MECILFGSILNFMLQSQVVLTLLVNFGQLNLFICYPTFDFNSYKPLKTPQFVANVPKEYFGFEHLTLFYFA